jgi:hypothetical protein
VFLAAQERCLLLKDGIALMPSRPANTLNTRCTSCIFGGEIVVYVSGSSKLML